MLDLDRPASDVLASDLSWIADRGIQVRPWPPAPHDTFSSPSPDQLILYLVDPAGSPPPCAELHDWIRLPGDRDELLARADRLLVRGRRRGAGLLLVDEHDVLRVGDQIVILSPQEARLIGALIDALGHLVVREDLMAAIWPDEVPDDPRALDNRLKSLRTRLDGLPLRIHTVRGRGLLLEWVADQA